MYVINFNGSWDLKRSRLIGSPRKDLWKKWNLRETVQDLLGWKGRRSMMAWKQCEGRETRYYQYYTNQFKLTNNMHHLRKSGNHLLISNVHKLLCLPFDIYSNGSNSINSFG